MADANAILCPLCGVKQRPGRRRCVRCRELFTGDAGSGSENVARLRGPAYVTAAVVAVAIVVAGIGWLAYPQRAEEGPASSDSVSEPAAAKAASHQTAPAVSAGASFIESRREGNAAYHAGNFEAAIEQYRKAIADHPTDAESLNNLGQVLVRTGRAAEAIPYFEKAVALNQTKWAFHFNLARALGQLENWKRSVAEYRTAAELFPDDYPTQYNLALALHKMGDEESAVSEFRRATDLAPEEPTFHLSLAMSLERLNRRPDAVQSYERYLQLAPNGADAERVRQRVQELKLPQ